MGECCTHWFLYRILKKIVERHREEVLAERVIPHHVLFREMSWMHRFSRGEAREVFRLMHNLLDGVRFGMRGLWISRDYLGRRDFAPVTGKRQCLAAWTGGGGV